MKSIFRLSVCCAGLVSLSACGDLRDRLEGRDDNSEVRPELVGAWESSCQSIKILDLFDVGGERQVMDFSAIPGRVEKKIQHFTDADCKEGGFERRIDASYDIVGNAEGIENGKNLNLTIRKVEVIPATAAAADKLNKAEACDSKDWRDGEAKDVTGKDCLGKKFEEGQVIFDIYKLDDNQLFVGKSSFFLDGDSAEDRPKELDVEFPLMKK